MANSTIITTERKKELMLYALEANFGNVSKSCKLLKMATSTYYRWLKEDTEFADKTENIRDISYRNIREHLFEAALKHVDKGNIHVLNKMIGIYFKHVPDDIKMVSRHNNVRLRMVPKFISTPQDPRREGYAGPHDLGRGGG